MQFVYDAENRQFVVFEGSVDNPDVDFRDKAPDVINFDQVKDVWIDVVMIHNKGKSFLEGVGSDLARDAYNAIYHKKLANMGAHMARAERIYRLLMNGR